MNKTGWLIFGLVVATLMAVVFALLSQSYLLQTKAERGIGSNSKAYIYIPE